MRKEKDLNINQFLKSTIETTAANQNSKMGVQ